MFSAIISGEGGLLNLSSDEISAKHWTRMDLLAKFPMLSRRNIGSIFLSRMSMKDRVKIFDVFNLSAFVDCYHTGKSRGDEK